MKANLVDIEVLEEMQPGDVMSFNKVLTSGLEIKKGIIYCCPKCGETSAGTENHEFNISTMNVKPSIIHRCGYHGYLKDGIFTNVTS